MMLKMRQIIFFMTKMKQYRVGFTFRIRLASYITGFLFVWTNAVWHSLQMIDEYGMHSSATFSRSNQISWDNYKNNTAVADLIHLDSIVYNVIRQDQRASTKTSEHDNPQRVSEPKTEDSRSKQDSIPQWMEDYFEWHSETLSTLNESNYQDQKYLLLRCLNIDNKCGGASDRLQTIPAMILAAYRMQRLLFIKWERPYPLEEYLVPSDLNWTLPTWLDQTFTYQHRLEIVTEVHLRHAEQSSKQLIQARFQAADYGATYYNTYRPDGPLFDEVFHDCWERLFEPSPAVASLVVESMSKLGLTPGKYSAVHIRSKYLTEKVESHSLIQNAVNCGSQLSHGKPSYIAADDNRAIDYAMAYGSSKGGVVVGRTDKYPKLHLDRGVDFLANSPTEPNSFPPSAYYQAFVDFYILSFSSCLSLHKGGFGRWAQLMMKNSSCVTNHGQIACQWAET
jgi:hypothetical protein